MPVKKAPDQGTLCRTQGLAEREIQKLIHRLKKINADHKSGPRESLLVVKYPGGRKEHVPITDMRSIKHEILSIYTKYKRIFERENIRWKNFGSYSSFTFVMVDKSIIFIIYHNRFALGKRKKKKTRKNSDRWTCRNISKNRKKRKGSPSVR